MQIALILALLLASTDLPSPPDASTFCAIWLADLTPEQVTSGTHGRFVFVPDSLVDEHGGCSGVEAAGPPGVSRTVQFAKGESDEGLDLVQPIVVEGELRVIRHRARAGRADHAPARSGEENRQAGGGEEGVGEKTNTGAGVKPVPV